MSKNIELPSFPYEVTIGLLTDNNILPDGDQIVLQESGSAASPDSVGFELQVATPDMWWKGLVLFKKDKSNDYEELVAGDGKALPQYKEIEMTKLCDRYLVLSKAKTLGVHSNVYNITDADTGLQQGKKYTVSWNKG